MQALKQFFSDMGWKDALTITESLEPKLHGKEEYPGKPVMAWVGELIEMAFGDGWLAVEEDAAIALLSLSVWGHLYDPESDADRGVVFMELVPGLPVSGSSQRLFSNALWCLDPLKRVVLTKNTCGYLQGQSNAIFQSVILLYYVKRIADGGLDGERLAGFRTEIADFVIPHIVEWRDEYRNVISPRHREFLTRMETTLRELIAELLPIGSLHAD